MSENYVADAILECMSSSNDVADDILAHYGIPRRSGRYPWGSGDNPYQHSGDFLSRVEELRKTPGYSWTDTEGKFGPVGTVYKGDTAIAHEMGLSSGQFRAATEIAKEERRSEQVAIATKLRKEGHSLNAIAEQMGFKNDSSVRALLDEDVARRKSVAQNNADFLKKLADEHGIVEVGKGTEIGFGVSKEKWAQSLEILRMEGYEIYPRRFEQKTNPGKHTTFTLLCKPGTEYKDVYSQDLTANDIYFPANEYTSHDGGDTFDKKRVYPKSLDSKRLLINYAEEGGVDKDGVIELRRGVKDLDLGDAHYAQVRILVDDTHYLKGMAVYADDLPDGVDVRFNTNKKLGTPLTDVLKPIKRNKDGTPKDDPFGALLKDGINDPDDMDISRGGQTYYYDDNGKKQLSVINKTREEGDWTDWTDTLPSQFLSKQKKELVKRQLGISEDLKQSEYEGIMDIDNPTVKKVMLEKFADSCDKAAETLKAAALPRQQWNVLLPLPSIKDNEVYAPNFKDGEQVCLVRFPHAGTFEIPYLTVNNRNKEGQRVITKNAADAVGVSKAVADQLSGADFDGDTVLVIPTGGSVNISHSPKLKELEDFDTKLAYGGKPEGTFRKLTKANQQTEMGKVTNLITDMTVLGATPAELAKIVKHSMVIIDAEKHDLDYQQSAKDNEYMALKKKWQLHVNLDGKESTAAATILSRATNETNIPKRRGSGWIDPETGRKIYAESGETYIKAKENKKEGTVSIINKYHDADTDTDRYVETIVKKDTNEVLYKGDPTREFKEVLRTQKATQMSQVDDAYKLLSPANNPIEIAYADYANSMKKMANTARLEILNTPGLKYDKEAAKVYSKEVDSLNNKLNISKKNAPLERQAQFIADTLEKEAIEKDPSLKDNKKDLKKFRDQALKQARAQTGAKRNPILISDEEWEAIQKGAISDNKLRDIMKYVDDERLKQLATPHSKNYLSPQDISRIQTLANNGYTNQQIAELFGISSSTVSKNLK